MTQRKRAEGLSHPPNCTWSLHVCTHCVHTHALQNTHRYTARGRDLLVHPNRLLHGPVHRLDAAPQDPLRQAPPGPRVARLEVDKAAAAHQDLARRVAGEAVGARRGRKGAAAATAAPGELLDLAAKDRVEDFGLEEELVDAGDGQQPEVGGLRGAAHSPFGQKEPTNPLRSLGSANRHYDNGGRAASSGVVTASEIYQDQRLTSSSVSRL